MIHTESSPATRLSGEPSADTLALLNVAKSAAWLAFQSALRANLPPPKRLAQTRLAAFAAFTAGGAPDGIADELSTEIAADIFADFDDSDAE